MGFYNIFRIIRTLLKDIFGYKTFKKILIIFVIFITIFFFVYNVLGYDIEQGLFNSAITFDIPSNYDNYNYVIIFGKRPNRTEIELAVIFTSDNEFYYTSGANGSYGTKQFNTTVKAGSYFSLGRYSAFQSSANSSTVQSQINSLFSYCATNYTLYNNNSNQSFLNAENQIVFSNIKVYKDNQIIYDPVINPTLDNTLEELENLSFNNFNISANSYSDKDLWILFYNRSLSNSLTTDGLYPITEKVLVPESIYYNNEDSTPSNAIYNIPIWKVGFPFNIGSTYEIRFATLESAFNQNNELYTYYEYIGEPIQFTISSNVTQDYINNLNQQIATDTTNDNNEQLQHDIREQTNAINNQTESINNINNSITDSTVDSSSIDLPTDTTNDPTSSGVDNIFQTIYNSFTSGTANDIVFPIPFTNKNITLQANYIRNALQQNNANWVITIIEAFWWYLISRFIIKDIMKKIRLIKQGNFDNIQNDNIKEDML